VSSLKAEIIGPFIKGTQETLATMAGIKVHRKDVYLKKGYRMYGDISGVIGLSGATVGTCAISMPKGLAMETVRRVLGEPEGKQLEVVEIRDGVGELVNMIVGCAKALLSHTKYRFDLTLPTIISGADHEFFQRDGRLCVVIIFDTDLGESFALEVSVATR